VILIKDELRKHYDLKPCTNKNHEFKIGKLMGEWIWANDHWSQLVDDKLQTLWFSIHTTETVDGLKIHSFTCWKLKVIVGFCDGN
jgi:hypothetical protein